MCITPALLLMGAVPTTGAHRTLHAMAVVGAALTCVSGGSA